MTPAGDVPAGTLVFLECGCSGNCGISRVDGPVLVIVSRPCKMRVALPDAPLTVSDPVTSINLVKRQRHGARLIHVRVHHHRVDRLSRRPLGPPGWLVGPAAAIAALLILGVEFALFASGGGLSSRPASRCGWVQTSRRSLIRPDRYGTR
jgi:hypothetical protein